MEHDNSYKLLFSHTQMVADLLRGFVKEPRVRAVDLTTLERVSGSHVSDDLRDREDDIIWRVRWGSDWLYVYILLEFQSTVDRFMAVRLLVYIGLLYQQLIRSKQLTASGKLPPVLPLVLYNGRGSWTAPHEVEGLIEEVPGGLSLYRPRLHYLLIDEGRYAESDLAALPNLVAALFRLENSREPEDVQRVLQALTDWLGAPEDDPLRRAFTVWLKRVLLPALVPGVSIPNVHDLAEVQAMLAERVIEWTQQWKEAGWREGLQEGRQEGLQEGRQEGRREGLQQGLQQGQEQERHRALAAERALLLRQIRKRFDEACAQAAAPRLNAIEDPEVLAEIGEWIVTCSTGEALLARVREIVPKA